MGCCRRSRPHKCPTIAVVVAADVDGTVAVVVDAIGAVFDLFVVDARVGVITVTHGCGQAWTKGAVVLAVAVRVRSLVDERVAVVINAVANLCGARANIWVSVVAVAFAGRDTVAVVICVLVDNASRVAVVVNAVAAVFGTTRPDSWIERLTIVTADNRVGTNPCARVVGTLNVPVGVVVDLLGGEIAVAVVVEAVASLCGGGVDEGVVVVAVGRWSNTRREAIAIEVVAAWDVVDDAVTVVVDLVRCLKGICLLGSSSSQSPICAAG